MDNSDFTYEDRDHGHNHRKHRRHHREERHRHDNDDFDDGREFSSRRSKDEKHRDGERHRYSSRDSPDDVEHRHGRSKSNDRGDMDSAERDRDERHRDRDRHHRSARDSPRDVEPHRERSRSYERGLKDSVERDQIPQEESVERRSSKKRKEHAGGNEDTSEKRGRLLDGTKEEKREVKRERRHFEDRINEDTRYLNGNHEERRRDERQSKDKMEEVWDVGERRKERKFKDRFKEEQSSYGEDRREERRPSDVVKEENMSDGEGARVVSREERRGERMLKDRENVDKLGEKRSKDRVREEYGYQEEMKPQFSVTSIEQKAAAEKFDSKQMPSEKETSRTMNAMKFGHVMVRTGRHIGPAFDPLVPAALASSAPVPRAPTSSAPAPSPAFDPLVPAASASSGPASDGGSNIDSQPHGLPCWISGNKIEPDGAVRFTTSLVQAHIPGPLESFRLFPIGVRNALFEMFLNKYTFVRAEDQGRCRSVWEATAQTNYRKSLYEARAKAKKATGTEESQTWKEHFPSWIKREDWEALCDKWADPGWRNKSNKGKANREAQPQKNLHTGGSLSFSAHKEKMTQQFQHEIPFRDLFEKTHKRKGAAGEDTEYVSDRAREVAAEYDRHMIEKYGEGTQHPELDPAAWVAAAGPANKGRVYGFGQSLDATAVSSSFSSTGAAPPCTSSTFRTSVDASQPPSDFTSIRQEMSRLRQEIRQDMVHVLTEFMSRMSSQTAPAQDHSQSGNGAADDEVADLGADDDAPI